MGNSGKEKRCDVHILRKEVLINTISKEYLDGKRYLGRPKSSLCAANCEIFATGATSKQRREHNSIGELLQTNFPVTKEDCSNNNTFSFNFVFTIVIGKESINKRVFVNDML